MHTETRVHGAIAILLAVALSGFSAAAMAQTPAAPTAPPPAAEPPPAGAAYPPATYAPAPGQPPAPGYAPAPVYAPPPPGYAAPGYAAPGYAPPGYAPPPPPVNLHDGFYLRLHLGVGFTNISGSNAAGEAKLSGAGPSFGIAIGGAPAPNFIIFGNLFGTSVSDPDQEVDGVPVGTASGTATLAGVGAGAAYYIQPLNLYLSGTLAGMQFQASESNGNVAIETNTGFGAQALVGKEWWVSQDWGLGVAAEFVAASMKDKVYTDTTWTATSFGLLFSATYN